MNTTCQTIRHALQETPTEATYKFLGDNGFPFYYCEACMSSYGLLDNSDLTLQPWGDGEVVLAERERRRAECMDAHPAGKARQTPTATGYVATGEEGEVIVTDSETGGQKGEKLARMGALDPQALYTLTEVAGMGASKYATWNYMKGYDWSLSYNALQRHMMKFWMGENLDPESGLPHLAHAAWHALALLSFQQRGLGNDDRFQQTPNTTD